MSYFYSIFSWFRPHVTRHARTRGHTRACVCVLLCLRCVLVWPWRKNLPYRHCIEPYWVSEWVWVHALSQAVNYEVGSLTWPHERRSQAYGRARARVCACVRVSARTAREDFKTIGKNGLCADDCTLPPMHKYTREEGCFVSTWSRHFLHRFSLRALAIFTISRSPSVYVPRYNVNRMRLLVYV